jgi:glyoxalase family protein
MSRVHGLHHVTAIAGDPRENLAFYTGVLGLRLVKRTVNQDAIDTYHFFYADAEGSPGTDLTFFPWPQMAQGRRGTGLADEVSLAVPVGTLDYWSQRLLDGGVAFADTETRFGETCLPFQDPHGLRLSLVETTGERPFVAWGRSPVSEEHQIRGLHSVRVWEADLEATASFLTDRMGLSRQDIEGGWHRLVVDDGGPGLNVDLRQPEGHARGHWGPGSVHHVAWRLHDSEEELALRAEIEQAGLTPAPQIDRFWFQSVYFREPGGVLFELATDGPGFSVDEDLDHLGETLILPPWLEDRRAEIEAGLPPA